MGGKNGLAGAAAAATNAACPAKQNCPPPKVSPLITVAAPKIVLVKKAYQNNAHRIQVTLKTDSSFTGTGSLTSAQAAQMRMFDRVRGGKLLALPLALKGDELTRGRVVYVEAASPSAAMNDTKLSLSIAGGSKTIVNSPATDTLTRVELQLDLCQYKPTPGGADPAPLSDADKIGKGRNLHLQDAKNLAGRCLLIVKQAKPFGPSGYTGSVVLVAQDGRVRTFPYGQEVAKAGEGPATANPLSTANSAIPASGLKLWVEGTQVSAAVLDTGFTVEISDLPRREGDRANVTVARAVVDICQSRPDPKKDPLPIGAANKMNPGRFIHVQNPPDNNHGRAMVILHRVEPAKFIGNLELQITDTATNSASARAQLFDAEAPGGPVLANPLTVSHDGTFPAAGQNRWLQGNTVSGALVDTDLRLRIVNAEGHADRAAMTVVKFTQIQATIHPTPANTPANGAAMTPAIHPPANHTFTAAKASEDFASNLPLVLMRGADPDIVLDLTAAPAGLPIRWTAIRNPADHSSLGGRNDVPVVAVTANTLRATLGTGSSGSFRIRPYIDCNGSSKYDIGEPSIPLNLVLANAVVVSDRSRAKNANLRVDFVGGFMRIQNGLWTGGLTDAGMTMDLVADVTGGGPDGLLGINSVFAGLVNNLHVDRINATYRDTSGGGGPVDHVLTNVYVPNGLAAGAAFGGKRLFLPGAAPAELIFPHLDTGRHPGAGQGGDTACMGQSNVVSRPARAVGQRFTVQCIDSPMRVFPRFHPHAPFAAAELHTVHYEQQFVANFCFWTNTKNPPESGATGHAADRLYSVVSIVPWSIGGDWTVTYDPLGVGTATVVNPHKITNTKPSTIKPIGRAQDHAVEVRPPSGIQEPFAWKTT